MVVVRGGKRVVGGVWNNAPMGSGADGVRPSGTVTFLFTDIEGSTRRWEDDADAMRTALAVHDEVLRSAIENCGGWLFKHTGDGVCAAFASARAAIDAAVAAQRLLGLPVRMGIATGEAEQRGDDYFGPALNRAARVMAVGHGGQVLLSISTASLVSGVDLLDLGEHRLRDLSGVEHLFQVRAEGLATIFPPLKTVNAVPGNLPVQATSFVGREQEISELTELIRAHRLVTLTGVGGVGKTRLAVQVAAELVPEFPDGVWLVELAPVGDPAAAPDVVASALGIIVQAGLTVTASVANALAGRRLLVVLDNCEHVLDAAADLVEAVLARTNTVTVIATSREGLRVGGELLWPVPSLDVKAGATSAAVELFVERARAVKPGFRLDNDTDSAAVTEICTRLDGIALAIELAAARMVSMSPTDVRDRLGDRFRLLSGGRRGLERHQTLRHAVQWSYELLTDDECVVLRHASVFADGFDVAAITELCGSFDEYVMLDLVDSLVRKSLVTAQQSPGGRARYGLLESIRQFAEDELAATGAVGDVRDRHSRYYAAQAIAYWDGWDGPGYDTACDWVEAEFDNLRAGFRWATDQADLKTATAIAAHTTMLAVGLQQFEPVGWAEELLPSAIAAKVAQLPRLHVAAGICMFKGRPEDAVGYAQAASVLQNDPRYQPFAIEWAAYRQAFAQFYAGRPDQHVKICTALATRTGLARVMGLCGLAMGLPNVGRSGEATAIAEDALNAARARANPYWIAFAYFAYGFAFSETDPARALDTFRLGLAYTRQHRLPRFEALIARDVAGLEAVDGDLNQALNLFTASLDSFHQAGDTTDLAVTFAYLAVFYDRINQPEIAATLYGTTATHHPVVLRFGAVVAAVNHVRDNLGTDSFDRCVATGAAMDTAEAVRYARTHIEAARFDLAPSP